MSPMDASRTQSAEDAQSTDDGEDYERPRSISPQEMLPTSGPTALRSLEEMSTSLRKSFDASSFSSFYSMPSHELFAGNVASVLHLTERASLLSNRDKGDRYPNFGPERQQSHHPSTSFSQPEVSSGWSMESVAGSDASLTEHLVEQQNFVPDWHDFGSYRQYATQLMSFRGDAGSRPPMDPSRLWFLEWAERGPSPTGMERACEDLRNRVAEEIVSEGEAWWETSSSEGDVLFTPSETDSDKIEDDEKIEREDEEGEGVEKAYDEENEEKSALRMQVQEPSSAKEGPLNNNPQLSQYEEYLVWLWNDYFGEGNLHDWQRLMADLGLGRRFKSKSQCRRALQGVWVNVVQFLHSPHKPRDVLFFSGERDLAALRMGSLMLFPRRAVPAGSPLKVLLSHVRRHWRHAKS